MESASMAGGGEKEKPVFSDIRRYYCEYCGICRSKKSLIRSHVLSNHEDKLKDVNANEDSADGEATQKGPYTCQECGASFRKPAYLKQHMQSHSLENSGL